jgi:hypothetical protein
LWKVEGVAVERGLIYLGHGWLKERWAGLADLTVEVYVVIERDKKKMFRLGGLWGRNNIGKGGV